MVEVQSYLYKTMNNIIAIRLLGSVFSGSSSLLKYSPMYIRLTSHIPMRLKTWDSVFWKQFCIEIQSYALLFWAVSKTNHIYIILILESV